VAHVWRASLARFASFRSTFTQQHYNSLSISINKSVISLGSLNNKFETFKQDPSPPVTFCLCLSVRRQAARNRSSHHVLSTKVREICEQFDSWIVQADVTGIHNSWLPLLFIPTNASPLFIVSFVALTYIIHRPCVYCSALLLILFVSSCHWSDRCIFDLRSNWFAPRYSSEPSDYGAISRNNASMAVPSNDMTEFVFDTVNSTAKALAGAAMEGVQQRLASNGLESRPDEWTGVGLEWMRSLLGRREWTLPCVDVKVRL
jgi:hypothetical protein